MNIQVSKREHYVDVGKGLLILLVVLGHCVGFSVGGNCPLKKWIYAFKQSLSFSRIGWYKLELMFFYSLSLSLSLNSVTTIRRYIPWLSGRLVDR